MDPAPNVDSAAAPTRRPRPKLNADTLLSERGFKYLRTHFNDISFDGPGYEVEDLDKLMLYYREWAHYLFPEMKFSDFTTKTRKECSSRMMKQYLHDLRRDANRIGSGNGGSVDFTEFDVGVSDIKNLLNITKPEETRKMDEDDTGKEKIVDNGKEKMTEEPDFSDFDLGDTDNFSDEERLLEEMQL